MTYKANNINTKIHCFFGSRGGVSGGKYTSLNTNLSSQDLRLNVEHNFAIIAEHFGMNKAQMFTVRQNTSSSVVWADKPSRFRIVADGMATDKSDILLCVKTADCAPVLLCDAKHGVIGVAHAGWRGAVKGVVQNVAKLMLKHGAQKQDIAVAIGPCIQKESFEVKDDMRQFFLQQSTHNDRYFTGKDNIYKFDLPAYIIDALHNIGIENISDSGIDTYTSAEDYFSYRRYTKLNLIEVPRDYPTQFSCIRL